MKLAIGHRTYATKKAAAEACRLVLYRYSPGESVSPADHLFLLDLLDLHPEGGEKAGAGVASFQVEQNGPTRGFWLTRVDGSRTDFSFLACLTPPSRERQALTAFRTAIMDQIATFRATNTDWTCPITGDHLTRATAHIDHDPPFVVLVDAFLRECGVELGQVEVMPTTDGSTMTRFADRDLASAWSDFHRANARLRAVSARANLSKGARGAR